MLHWLEPCSTDLDVYGKGPLYPGSVEKWMPTDTAQRFSENSRDPIKHAQLQAHGWTADSIRYRGNDHGFRMDVNMDAITPGECDFYLGCSITFGTGLNLEDTWAAKLSRRQGRIMVNLAHPGTGLETQHRMLMCWAAKLKPKRAWTLGAFWQRREVMVPDRPSMRMGPWSTGEELRVYQHLSTDIEARLAFLRTAAAIKHTCQLHGIELWVATCDDPGVSPDPGYEHQTARDLMHWGRDWHDWVVSRPGTWWQRQA